MKNFYIKIFSYFSYLYLFFFGRKFFYKFNLLLLKLSLKSIGYSNYGNYNFTGEKAFIKSLKKYGPEVCIDIGAHTGSYSKLLVDELGCRVICFEPNKYSFRKLKKLILLFGDKIQPFNFAVTDNNKKINLYYGDKLSQLASLSKDLSKINFIGNSNKNKILVKGVSLDSFFNKYKKRFNRIDFIKIDAEGHEFEVLLGAKKVIKRFKPNFIQLEFNWHQLLKSRTLLSFKTLLSDYDAYRILPLNGNIVKIDLYRPEDNIFHLSNIVFKRRKIIYGKK